MICETCRRPLDSRECSDPLHRAHRGFPAEVCPVDSLVQECPKCRTTQPESKFWDTRRKCFAVKCATCRYQARHYGPAAMRRKATRAAEKQAVEAFWNEQATR